MAGLLGSGRTETARLLFGADRADSGEVTIDGEAVRLRNPRVALAKGIAYASENRRTEGLVGNLSVRANIILAMQSAARLGASDPATPAGRARRPLREGPRHPPTRSRGDRRQPCRAATSRRCCSPAGCSRHPSC